MTGTSVIAPSPGMPRAALNTGAGLWPSSIAVAGRTVRKFARTPQLIVFTTIQSALFLPRPDRRTRNAAARTHFAEITSMTAQGQARAPPVREVIAKS